MTTNTNAKKAAFLAAYSVTATIRGAARSSKVDPRSHYRWLKDDPEYAEAFAEAKLLAIDGLEEVARQRAVEGTYRLKFDSHGKPLIDPETKKPYREFTYSDVLLIFLLKAARPEVYRDRIDNHHSGKVGHSTVQVYLPENNRALKREVLNEPEYLEFQRNRIAESVAIVGSVCGNDGSV